MSDRMEFGEMNGPHRVGDAACPVDVCSSKADPRYPRIHDCGGLIHAAMRDGYSHGDFSLDLKCDKCGKTAVDTSRPLSRTTPRLQGGNRKFLFVGFALVLGWLAFSNSHPILAIIYGLVTPIAFLLGTYVSDDVQDYRASGKGAAARVSRLMIGVGNSMEKENSELEPTANLAITVMKMLLTLALIPVLALTMLATRNAAGEATPRDVPLEFI